MYEIQLEWVQAPLGLGNLNEAQTDRWLHIQ
jgi:hypothetical protein